jgi:hypothetical protein
MSNRVSGGVLIRATISSKYLLLPWKSSEVRVERTARVRRGTQLVLYVGQTSRGSDVKVKYSEPCQHGEARDHCLGCNISGKRPVQKVKYNKVMDRQKYIERCKPSRPKGHSSTHWK